MSSQKKKKKSTEVNAALDSKHVVLNQMALLSLT